MAEKQDLSIHPRNWPNGNGKKKNTCAPMKKNGRTFKYVSDNVLRRETSWKQIPPAILPGYRKPGSRNPTKLGQR